METIKEFVERNMLEIEAAAGLEPTLEGSPPGTVNELWIKWFMTRYQCSREVAQAEGDRRVELRTFKLDKRSKLPGNKR